MNANVPVLPIAGAAALRGSFAVLALVTRWLKDLARARRHRREARALAGLDRRMLADIGVSHADISDAFSSHFWEDPTELLCARAHERRSSRPSARRYAELVSPDAPPLQPVLRRALPML